MITGIALTALLVRDYQEALAFYCEKLGFLVVEDTSLESKRWVRIRAPGGGGGELLLSKASDEKQAETVGNQAGGRVFLFLSTNDLDHDYKKMCSLCVEFTEAPVDHSYGKVAVFKDLYGNRIDLIEPKTAIEY